MENKEYKIIQTILFSLPSQGLALKAAVFTLLPFPANLIWKKS